MYLLTFLIVHYQVDGSISFIISDISFSFMCFSFYYENHDEAEFLYLLSPLSRVLCYIINDYLEQLLCLLYENMMNDAQTGNITGHNTIASALTNIVTGKEDANFHLLIINDYRKIIL